MEISKRLETIVSLVSPSDTVADIGTDHGYVPIELIRRGICKKGIAMDIGEGPLARARDHIRSQRMEDRIETRISDGLSKLSPGEADTIVIAGMGGSLMIRILAQGEAAARAAGQLILSPQSHQEEFRRFLNQNHYRILEEWMLEEEGKYYTILVVKDQEPEPYTEDEFAYGKRTVGECLPILIEYLHKTMNSMESIRDKLKEQESPRSRQRLKELDGQLEQVRLALMRLGEGED